MMLVLVKSNVKIARLAVTHEALSSIDVFFKLNLSDIYIYM